MNITFVPSREPFVRDDVTMWHAQHGWLWNIDVDDMFIGTLFCTLLCGDGCFVHFKTGKYITLPGAVVLAIMRKAMRMLSTESDVIFASIETRNRKLIQTAIYLGFGIVENGGWQRQALDGGSAGLRSGTEITLLKYYGRHLCYSKGKDQPTHEVCRTVPCCATARNNNDN